MEKKENTMKIKALLVGMLALTLSSPAFAAESAAGGLEFSGNTSILAGWQQDDSGALTDPLTGTGITLGGMFALVRGPRVMDRTTFNFYLDQFEVDLNKSFGENIRIRADLDFGRALSGSIRSTEGSNFVLEQGYVTAGILGGEFLIGRFNAPIGYYVVDRAFNPTVSFSNIYIYLTPTNVTGAKMYWSFNDWLDLNLYVINQMFDCLFVAGCLVGPSTKPGPINPGTVLATNPTGSADSAIPSWGMRLGFNWGEEDTASTVGISYMGGPEQPGNNLHLDHMFDLDFAIKLTENLLVAGEGIYYQRNNIPGQLGPNAKFAGGLLVIDWAASEIWDLFASYGYVHDFQGVVTGADMQVHNFVLGFGYQITEGAKFKFEGRADYFLYAATQGVRTKFAQAIAAGGPVFPVAVPDTNSWSFGAGGEFAYTF